MLLNFTIESFKFTSSIHENKIRSYITLTAITVGDILLFIGMLLGMYQALEMVYLSTILAIFSCVNFAIALRNLSKINEKLLLKIASTITSTNPDWPSFIDKKISQKAEAQMERNSKVEVVLILFSITFCLYCPYFYLITKPGITMDHPDLQIIPYFYTAWETKTLTQYFGKLFFEGLVSFSSMGGYLTFTAFMMYAITNLKMQVKEISRLLRSAVDTQVERYMIWGELRTSHYTYGSYILGNVGKRSTVQLTKSVESELVKMIRYHQFIHSYIGDITTFLHKPFSLFFVWYISSTVLFIFVFLQINDDWIFIMKISSLVIHGIIALHVYCNAAQTIYETNEAIMDSFYNASWYYFSPKTRKNFLFVLTLCQRKYQLKCFGMYVINLNLFLYALRTVYSVVNIIRVAQNE